MRVLDACCGGRMMWFQKDREDVVYMDLYPREKGCIEQQKNFSCDPDVLADFRDMPFGDEEFQMVVFDPPHITDVSLFSVMGKKYGTISSETYETDLSKGFDECWRVLKRGGTLVFKWNEARVKVSDVLKCFRHQPLFGHTTGKAGSTKWMCFLKT